MRGSRTCPIDLRHSGPVADEALDPVEVVRQGYDRLSARYRANDGDPERYRAWIDELLRNLRPSSQVLDLGCGNGIPVSRKLVEAGHAVTGIDLSDRQIERARHLVPGGTFLRADMSGHDLGNTRFDAVIALYSLIHVPIDHQPSVIANVADALVDGGLLLATLGWEAWTGSDPDWIGGGTEMWWSHADRDTYHRWLEVAGFEVMDVSFVPEGASGHALFWARRRLRGGVAGTSP
jgi:2-polyprenyl-3-methyl-5-hydroxy-6-metoxy-1,4-benzoquinol methylase